jgi:ribose 5-phosphate isomerase B
MKIALAADPRRLAYKQRLELSLLEAGHVVEDFGAREEKSLTCSQIVRPLAEAVAAGECQRGIVLGDTGSGEAIVANRLPGVRCAVCWNTKSARIARRQLNTNVLALGLQLMAYGRVPAIVEAWLTTPFLRRLYLHEMVGLDGPRGPGLQVHRTLPHRTQVPETISICCSVCGEEFAVPLDPSAGSSQEFVEECPVCCHAHVIRVGIDAEGHVTESDSEEGGYF